MSKSKAKEKEKPVRLEDVAEETGELVGKAIRKTWNVLNSFGKGVVDTLEKADSAESTCPHCGASNQNQSEICPACKRKI